MYACLYSLSVPVAALVKVAEGFTPRFEVVGPLVVLDLSGLSRLFGSPQEIGEHLRRAASGPVRIAMAPTQTTAALLALSRAGLTVVGRTEEAGSQLEMLAALPVRLLGDFERVRCVGDGGGMRAPQEPPATRPPPHVGEMGDALPYFTASLERTSEMATRAHCGGGGWKHPRDSHAATSVRRPQRAVKAIRETEHSHAASAHPAPGPPSIAPMNAGELRRGLAVAASGGGGGHPAPGACSQALAEIQSLLETLRRWGVKTFGALAALPAGDVYERLGARGVRWQRLARGEDANPLVPWVPEDSFEAALELEWPIEGLEPLSFVLGRLLEPLAERLERADRGATILHTHVRLVSKEVHTRTLQLPAPMRDAKTLRTLMLLDLESNPPSAAIDRVRVLIEPTPARVTQWMLFERAQPSPEQVSTLIARLAALMGESHVGSPRLVNSWKPGVFAMERFQVPASPQLASCISASEGGRSATCALRRFRLPVAARVHVQDGRPVRVTTDRRGVSGGVVVQAAGPWRTSGEWWNDAPTPLSHPSYPTEWDRDEWDVALSDGTVYRLYVERAVGHWFLEGIVD